MLSVEDAAAQFPKPVTSSWVRRLIREHRLPATKIGDTWVVQQADLTRFLRTDHHAPGHPKNRRHRKYERLRAQRAD